MAQGLRRAQRGRRRRGTDTLAGGRHAFERVRRERGVDLLVRGQELNQLPGGLGREGAGHGHVAAPGGSGGRLLPVASHRKDDCRCDQERANAAHGDTGGGPGSGTSASPKSATRLARMMSHCSGVSVVPLAIRLPGVVECPPALRSMCPISCGSAR